MPDLKEQLARRIRDRLRLHLGPNALWLAQAGGPLTLNSGEADEVADVTCEVLAELGLTTVSADELERLRANQCTALCRDVERERDELQAAVDRVNADHRMRSAWLLEPCSRHQGSEWRRDIAKCDACRRYLRTWCSNRGCDAWPCETHLTLRDESEQTCAHRADRPKTYDTRPTIVLDPAQNFGWPALARSRVTVEAVLERLDAGDDWEDAASDHGLTRADILVACWFEARYGSGPHPRDEWLDWLEAWEPALWKAASYDEIPLPYGWKPEEEL